MNDLIDRQAAIDATAEYLRDMAKIDNPSLPMSIDGWKPLAGKILDKVPSAQPEIIRCGDCKWYGRADKRRFYRGMDCLQKRIDTIVPDRDFCSKAERRTDE